MPYVFAQSFDFFLDGGTGHDWEIIVRSESSKRKREVESQVIAEQRASGPSRHQAHPGGIQLNFIGHFEPGELLEPVTHFLFGGGAGRAGRNRKTARATATLTLAAEAPDLDVLSRFGGSAFGLNHHRGFTHSFLGVPIVAVVVVGFIYLLWRLRGRQTRNPNLPPRWRLLFAYACLAGVSHILLDFTNNYGVRPFWPFSERWYSGDIVFILDPILLLVLALGLVLPSLFGLINEEIGAGGRASHAPRGRLAATLALVSVFAY